jgi:hypothetical protein
MLKSGLILIALFIISLAVQSPVHSQFGGSASLIDTNTYQDSLDTLGFFARDTTSLDSVAQKIVMRNHDHRNQVIVGSVVMFCLALTLVGMNNYNPRR